MYWRTFWDVIFLSYSKLLQIQTTLLRYDNPDDFGSRLSITERKRQSASSMNIILKLQTMWKRDGANNTLWGQWRMDLAADLKASVRESLHSMTHFFFWADDSNLDISSIYRRIWLRFISNPLRSDSANYKMSSLNFLRERRLNAERNPLRTGDTIHSAESRCTNGERKKKNRRKRMNSVVGRRRR